MMLISIRRFVISSRYTRPAVLMLIGWTFIVTANQLAADEPPANPVTTAGSVAEAKKTATPVTDAPVSTPKPRVGDRQRKAYIGLLALVGIAIAGLALLALTMVWGRHLRRQFRQPVPECELPARDFWFLKPAKPTVTESSLPDSHLPPHEPPPAD